MGGKGRIAAAAAMLAAAGLVHATVAPAEVAQRGGVRVAITGSLHPTSLPRTGSAPIAVSIAGRVVATRPGALPQLERIEIAINRHGKLHRRGIPLCRPGHIDPSTTREALAACGPSLIGEGSFSADVRIPDQSPFPSRGKVLAFNGAFGGRPAILAHVYGTEPVPTSYVLPISISQSRGTYGTVLEASLPQATGEWGYVTGLSLSLDRGYLRAGCPAPPGFPGAVFPLMRTSFAFAGGTEVSVALTRSCQVRS